MIYWISKNIPWHFKNSDNLVGYWLSDVCSANVSIFRTLGDICFWVSNPWNGQYRQGETRKVAMISSSQGTWGAERVDGTSLWNWGMNATETERGYCNLQNLKAESTLLSDDLQLGSLVTYVLAENTRTPHAVLSATMRVPCECGWRLSLSKTSADLMARGQSRNTVSSGRGWSEDLHQKCRG